jgi:hypothetical protein
MVLFVPTILPSQTMMYLEVMGAAAPSGLVFPLIFQKISQDFPALTFAKLLLFGTL